MRIIVEVDAEGDADMEIHTACAIEAALDGFEVPGVNVLDWSVRV
jgi:hypothetical protein